VAARRLAQNRPEALAFNLPATVFQKISEGGGGVFSIHEALAQNN
jgi:hypothetical protein